LLEEICILCYHKGAHPLIIATTDEYTARVYEEISEVTLRETSRHQLAAIKEVDVYITVESFKDLTIQT